MCSIARDDVLLESTQIWVLTYWTVAILTASFGQDGRGQRKQVSCGRPLTAGTDEARKHDEVAKFRKQGASMVENRYVAACMGSCSFKRMSRGVDPTSWSDHSMAESQQSSTNMMGATAERQQVIGLRLQSQLVLLFLLGTLCLSPVADAQTLCACTPSVYQFRLNFTLTCDDTSFALSQSITDIQCTTTPDVLLDTTTAEAYNIQFVELDQNRLVLKTTTVGTPQGNGAIVTYESYISAPEPGDERVPGSLQVGITARDATTSTVFQQWVLQYSNSCDGATYPVVSEGQQIGWTIVVRDEDETGAVRGSTANNLSVPHPPLYL
jgi:hypothetical protein